MTVRVRHLIACLEQLQKEEVLTTEVTQKVVDTLKDEGTFHPDDTVLVFE